MRRLTTALLAGLLGTSGLLAGCSASDAEYCGKLPGYFKTMAMSMKASIEDPNRLDAWAAEAKEMAELSPDELQEHWDFIVDYSGRMSAAGADLDGMKPGDVKKNGAAGNAIMADARERCDLP